MSFRTKLLIGFTSIVVLAVSGVAWFVSSATRRASDEENNQRTTMLVQQFQKEFDRRREEVVRRVESLRDEGTTFEMAVMLSGPRADPSQYVGNASGLAASHKLELLELIANDGSVISSAQWPQRFGYENNWVTQTPDWEGTEAFLRTEELPDGAALVLEAVRASRVNGKNLYVVGGLRLNKDFFSSLLVLPDGMRALLYRNVTPQFQPEQVIDANGPVAGGAKLAGLIEEIQKSVASGSAESQRAVIKTITWTSDAASAETFYALPKTGRNNELLAVLLIGSSRAGQVRLESQIRTAALIAGIGGILFALLLSWWAAARVTRPVEKLAAAAREVAAGNWSTHVPVRTKDEIGELARAFNQMTAQLTEQRERLVQSERVAAWRELARRLAHELKNPLFPLQLTVENLQRARAQDLHEFDLHFREGTAALLAEIDNLKGIINRFADFAKMPAPELRAVDINQIVRDVIRLYEPQFGAVGRPAITPELLLDEDIETIHADPELLHRALSNLVLNALDAMPSGGTLALRTQRQGNGVFLEISDTGSGLTREECERLFTPYYTTKKHGTGLGLAIVQSIVSDHGGKISVRSEPNRGTTFSIELPERPPAFAPQAIATTESATARKPVVAPPWPDLPPAPARTMAAEVAVVSPPPPYVPEPATETKVSVHSWESQSSQPPMFTVVPVSEEVPDQDQTTSGQVVEAAFSSPNGGKSDYTLMALEPPPPSFIAEPEAEEKKTEAAENSEPATVPEGDSNSPRRGPWGIWRTFTGS